jgi:hypothetical protein
MRWIDEVNTRASRWQMTNALYWVVPSLLCLALNWRSLGCWFRADDFAWLSVGRDVTGWRLLLHALFSPSAHRTMRPLSERALFMAAYGIFGLDPLPFRVLAFATQFANLALLASIGARVTGSRAAGFWAATLWALNSSLLFPLAWACNYCEVLCGFCLLLAFHFLLRYVDTGQRRYNLFQWAVFLVGFGVLELNVVYPALAAGYTWLCARPYFRRTLPLFAASAVYFVLHNVFAPPLKTGLYAIHVTSTIFRTLAVYWAWSLEPAYLRVPRWLALLSLLLLTAGLAVFTVRKLRAGNRTPLFFVLWYVSVLSPLLLLRDHLTEYYVFLPVAGLCWLSGWAIAESPRAATGLALLYAALSVPHLLTAVDRNYRLTLRVRDLVEGVASAHEQHPNQAILLDGVDNDLFWNALRDHPFRLISFEQVYLAPGSERAIAADADRGDLSEFLAPAGAVAAAIERGRLVVYDVRGPRQRNITSSYRVAHDNSLPRRVDATSPLLAPLLGPEWYASDGSLCWMPRRATLRMGAPSAPGQKLYLRGICPEEQLRAGPLGVTVTAGDVRLPQALIRPGENSFELTFDLPAALVGRAEMAIAVEVSRAIRPASDPRELGLGFGVFEVK